MLVGPEYERRKQSNVVVNNSTGEGLSYASAGELFTTWAHVTNQLRLRGFSLATTLWIWQDPLSRAQRPARQSGPRVALG